MAKTIVGELKDLFVKFGGDTDNLTGKETTAEMIDAIEQIYEGGGNDFVVTYTAGEGDAITADKTFAEITAAIEGGKSVKAVISGQPLILSTVSESAIEFVNVVVNNDIIIVNVLAHNDEDTISVRTETAGGSNDFVVTYTENGGTYTADKTYAEIVAAYEAGKNIRAIYGERIYYPMEISSTQAVFVNMNFKPSGTQMFTALLHGTNDTVMYATN